MQQAQQLEQLQSIQDQLVNNGGGGGGGGGGGLLGPPPAQVSNTGVQHGMPGTGDQHIFNRVRDQRNAVNQ